MDAGGGKIIPQTDGSVQIENAHDVKIYVTAYSDYLPVYPSFKGRDFQSDTKNMIKDHVLDRPNSYIGRTVPRPNAKRLLAGRGTFTDDVRLSRMTHVAFLRSTYAHAEIVSIDVAEAKESEGVVAVVTGAEMAEVCSPWVGGLSH